MSREREDQKVGDSLTSGWKKIVETIVKEEISKNPETAYATITNALFSIYQSGIAEGKEAAKKQMYGEARPATVEQATGYSEKNILKQLQGER